MDSVDRHLLELLQRNSRAKISELAHELNLSRPSIYERMLKLEDAGIIEGYSARISLRAIHREILLFIQLRSLKAPAHAIETKIEREDDILECHRLTGEVDYLIKAAVSSMDDMKGLIDRLMPLGDVSTSIVISSPVAHRYVLPKIKA